MCVKLPGYENGEVSNKTTVESNIDLKHWFKYIKDIKLVSEKLNIPMLVIKLAANYLERQLTHSINLRKEIYIISIITGQGHNCHLFEKYFNGRWVLD